MQMGQVAAKYKREPIQSFQFPPIGYEFAHRLKNGDNWSTLAVDYQRDDVWDIIYYNFHTFEPKIVTWCMEKYLGCKYKCDNGKSYSFSSQDDPGLVYIPPQWWTPGEDTGLTGLDLMALDRVLNILGSFYINKIKFVNPYNVATYPAMFQQVASRIMEGRISVRFLVGNKAEYDPDNNRILLGFLDTASAVQRSRIVHECLHAAHDVYRRSMLQGNMEADSYIAQMIYLIKSHSEYATTMPTGENYAESQIYKYAWPIAQHILGTPGYWQYPTSSSWDGAAVIPADAYVNLTMAIQMHPDYATKASEMRQMDGV